MLQPADTLPAVPMKPAPWSLRGQGWVVALRLSQGSPVRTAFMPPALAASAGGRYALLMFVDYAQSDCGPYHELLLIPGSYAFADGKRHLSISRILVSTWDSVVNGRANWGIPKDRADFRVDYATNGSRTDRIRVSSEGREMADLQLTALPFPPLPVFGSLVPERLRTLAQQFDGDTFLYAPASRGWVQPGRLQSWRFDGELFPDLAAAQVLAAVKIRSFAMTFPVARRLR